MAETCIVCLVDLGSESPGALPHPASPPTRHDGPQEEPTTSTSKSKAEAPTPSPQSSGAELIAHLLPCGHNLHDSCLRPWVERANSCPICRASFNSVELYRHLGGPVVDSYPVSDRVQEAEFDPSMLIEDLDDEPGFAPCLVCDNDEHEEHILLCDGCDRGFHTWCVDLDSVPVGAWFCNDCATTRAIESVNEPFAAAALGASYRTAGWQRTPHVRTREQLRQRHHRNQVASSDWARVWQTVNNTFQFDLDFPFHTDATLQPNRHRGAGSRLGPGRRLWERRLQVARQQGAAGQLEEAAAVVLEPPPLSHGRARPEPPEPESVDELLSWNAFEKARDIEADPRPRPRKTRKSATASPSDADGVAPRRSKRQRSATSSPKELAAAPKPERRLKRPRTRRAVDLVEHSGEEGSEASSAWRVSIAQSYSHPAASATDSHDVPPSFLQSLLNEVQSAGPSAPEEQGGAELSLAHPQPLRPCGPLSDDHSPQHSSPAVSPVTSNHPSPRALSTTPPPTAGYGSCSSCPGSPAPLTSRIEPIYSPPQPRASSPTRVASPPRVASPLSDSGLGRSRVPRSSERRSTHVPRWAHHGNGANGVGRSASPTALARAPEPQSGDSPSPPPPPPLCAPTGAPETSGVGPPALSPTLAASPLSGTAPSLSLESKTAVQGLVKQALQRPWHNGELDKEQYVRINKSVSRMLYDLVAAKAITAAPADPSQATVLVEDWKGVAREEVARAVRETNRRTDPS